MLSFNINTGILAALQAVFLPLCLFMSRTEETQQRAFMLLTRAKKADGFLPSVLFCLIPVMFDTPL